MFQVSGEDLRVSDGWVRCGFCDGVFDASAHLQVMPPAQAEVAARGVSGYAPDVPQGRPHSALDSLQISEVESPNPQPATSLSEPSGFFRSATSGDVSGRTKPDGLSESAATSSAVLRQEDVSARQDGRPLEYMPSGAPRRSARRVWLGGAVVLFLAAGLLGWVRQERQALVQRAPYLLGAIEKLCQISACEVQAPRLLQAILIEGAVLEEAGPAQHKVRLILRNRGSVAVAMPALDVKLTDPRGDVLVHHTVLPAQFAPGITRLSPDAQQSVSFMVPSIAQSQSTDLFLANANQAPSMSATASATKDAQASPTSPSASAPASPVAPVAEPVPAPSISGHSIVAFYP